jgi:hypothetical protein
MKAIDEAVLLLAGAGYLNTEIQEALDLPEEALCAALNRLAEWLAPTAASRRSIDLEECLPFDEGFFVSNDWLQEAS